MKHVALLLSILLIVTPLNAAVIDNVAVSGDGIIEHGKTITLTGTGGMGAVSTDIILNYDDFETGSSSGWDTSYSTTTNNQRSNSSYSSTFNFSSSQHADFNGIDGVTSESEFYIFLKARNGFTMTNVDEESYWKIKLHRMKSTADATNSYFEYFDDGFIKSVCEQFSDDGSGNNSQSFDFDTKMPEDTWFTLETWQTYTTSATGKNQLWVNGEQVQSADDTNAGETGFDVDVAPGIGYYDVFRTTTVGDETVQFDNVWVANSPARIVITDNATYANSTGTKTEVQEFSSWTDTSTAFVMEEGEHSGTVYIHMFDDDNTLIDLNGALSGTGYEIEIGGEGGDAPEITTKSIGALRPGSGNAIMGKLRSGSGNVTIS